MQFLLSLFFVFSLYAVFSPTRTDLKALDQTLSGLKKNQKVVLLSDWAHRGEETRGATVMLAHALSKKFPNEQVCIIFETTPKIEDAWAQFKSSNSYRGYSESFYPLGLAVSKSVSDLPPTIAGQRFIEPSLFQASYIKDNLPNLKVYGGDLDYLDPTVFSTLYNNRNPSKRALDDNVFAKLFIEQRNKAMASKTNSLLKSNECSRVILSAGSSHIRDFEKDLDKFPNYTGPKLKGVTGFIDQKVAGLPYIVDIGVDNKKICPAGMARSDENCLMKNSLSQLPAPRRVLEVPKGFIKGRIPQITGGGRGAFGSTTIDGN